MSDWIGYKRPEVVARNHRVLDAWANGGDAKAIAERFGLTPTNVTMIAYRARLAGDPRAAARKAWRRRAVKA